MALLLRLAGIPDDCSYCFVNGAFTTPESKTAADMQRFCIGKLKEMGCRDSWLVVHTGHPAIEPLESTVGKHR